MAETKLMYKRVLIKISGEALSNSTNKIYDFDFIDRIADVIAKCVSAGVQVGIVVGAGNIWRGRFGTNMDRTRADHMGMLATVINALALQDALEQKKLDVRVMTAIEMHEFAEPYIRNKAISHLNKGRVVIYGCGIGAPFFSTDTAAVLRAIETNVDIILLAKSIDMLYTADPKIDINAKPITETTYSFIMENHLSAIDSTAAALANDNNITSLMFGVNDPENIYKAIIGKKIGTIIKGDEK